ncbi:efflux transporter, RND family, MFP subunit [Clostridiales bacterium oral taxon 876 str. F0540]|nr:efflux transporter, RND family, MFP subunit [Clostridiales bacterium oral taxon 876 str. F0540]
MNFNKSYKKLIAIIVTGSLALTGCGILPTEEQTLAPPLVKPQKQEYELYDVVKKDITKAVIGNGTVISSNENNVFAKENGKRLKGIKIKFGQMVKKGDVLLEFDTNDLESNIKLQELSLKKAQINNDRASVGTDEYAKQLAAIDVQVEKTKLDVMKSQLQASKLTASIDGKVDFIESLKEGDVVEPYKTLVTISDPNKLQVNYKPSDTSNISKLQTGMKVSLSLNGKSYEGVVSQLPTSGRYKDSAVIDFKEAVKGVNLGDSMELNIILETKKNTIVIPKQGLKNFMGNNTVEVLDGNKKVSIDVEKGIESATEVEILSGLKEGQKVILN